MVSEFIDFYNVLRCDKKASLEEIKKNYQNLILTFHPDKNNDSGNYEQFINIQKAWSILKDPESRKRYDALLSCEEHNEYLLYDTLSVTDLIYCSDNKVYSYQCRCGGNYCVNVKDIIPPKVFVECDECSLAIQVIVPSCDNIPAS